MIKKINLQIINKYDLFESIKDAFYKPVYDRIIERIYKSAQINKSIFGKFENSKLIGAIGIIKKNDKEVEIEYIGVKTDARKNGIGKNLVLYVKDYYNLDIVAETDEGAVNFYASVGFDCKKIIKEYNGEKVVRYKCKLQI